MLGKLVNSNHLSQFEPHQKKKKKKKKKILIPLACPTTAFPCLQSDESECPQDCRAIQIDAFDALFGFYSKQIRKKSTILKSKLHISDPKLLNYSQKLCYPKLLKYLSNLQLMKVRVGIDSYTNNKVNTSGLTLTSGKYLGNYLVLSLTWSYGY